MNKQIILLIGGPSSGKSTLIEQLKQTGYVCYPEISRQVIIEAQQQGIDQLFLEQPLLFSELLLKSRIKQYNLAQGENANIIFIDRGIPDVIAYMDYIGNPVPAFFDDACKTHIYSKIFILPIWKKIYVSDSERYESYEQAILIQKHLIKTYKKYGYELIDVPKDTVENRLQFIIENLNF